MARTPSTRPAKNAASCARGRRVWSMSPTTVSRSSFMPRASSSIQSCSTAAESVSAASRVAQPAGGPFPVGVHRAAYTGPSLSDDGDGPLTVFMTPPSWATAARRPAHRRGTPPRCARGDGDVGMVVSRGRGPAVVMAELLRDDMIRKLFDVEQVPSEVMARRLIERRLAESDRAADAVPMMRASRGYVVMAAQRRKDPFGFAREFEQPIA